ncbi:MAG: DNA polymerase/3'-5' exonuclease PolX [Acidobacteriota bacterium]|nr:DNA polymerase/3'-5' exonuclease PolX [Acidobacteriota bacterium]
MNRKQIAESLEEIGLLLELLGENPFKTRAYHNGARILRGLDDDLELLVRENRLTEIKGIGVALADKIGTLVRDGGLPYLAELRTRVPPGLLQWIKIPGLGSKKVRAIHVALDISTLGELEYACRENRLRDLPGFGQASQDKILRGIDAVRRHAGRFRQPVIQREAERLLALVTPLPGVERAEVAGSVRRRVETSKDIDVLVAAADAEPVMAVFAEDDAVEEVIGRGPTKCSVRLKSGPTADLRVVGRSSYACALNYFTGSKAHNVALRARAQASGMRLNEYALTRQSDGEELPVADEAALYGHLGLDYVEPELRENLGEIEASETHELPDLLKPTDLKGVLHVHSNWSDGSASIEEMAEAARSRGLQYLGLCDHSKAAAYAGGLDADRVAAQHEEIERLNEQFGDEFRVLKGIEVDILEDGSLDFPDDVMATFDVVVASVHSRFNLDETKQTDRILRAIGSPYVDILGHPTGRLLLARDGYPVRLEAILERAAENGVAVEVNAHPHRLDLDWQHLRFGLRRGLKTAINPDAHAPEGLDDMRYGVGIARKGWCQASDVLNAWPLDRLLEFLRDRRQRAGA